MKNILSKLGFSIFLLMLLSACANTPFYHKNLMRGQVVTVNDSQAIVCIGSHNTSLEGKSFNVYRIEHNVGTQEGDDGYRRRYTGSLTIDAIIDQHFARATVTDGEVAKHNVIELSR